jgi:hypothetical protein
VNRYGSNATIARARATAPPTIAQTRGRKLVFVFGIPIGNGRAVGARDAPQYTNEGSGTLRFRTLLRGADVAGSYFSSSTTS